MLPASGYVAVLRHDVDRLPGNALKMAQIENELGLRASYFFRITRHVWNPEIVKNIVALGHELSYHYENLSFCKGNSELAIKNFTENLAILRQYYPTKTICMHGSPASKWDNRKLWEKYNYRDYGIIAEPYFDIDYSKVFYITDTGRGWNKKNVNIRDNVVSAYNIYIESASHLIILAEQGLLPKQIIINTHPHRWFNFGLGWIWELISQNLKNIIKEGIIKAKRA
jgi:hypothetical protein